MTTLTEFLSTADADSATALVQARAFSEQVLKPLEGRMMNERTVLGLIGMQSGETFMQSLEAAPDNMLPTRVKAWFKPSEAGIDVATPSAVGLIDTMAGAGAITEAEAGLLKGYAYDTVTPFANATLYDVTKERGVFSYVEIETVALVGGYAVINVPVETERHNPRLEVKNPRTLKWQPLAPFIGVSAAGKYESFIPPQFREWEKRVEDAYGVIGIA